MTQSRWRSVSATASLPPPISEFADLGEALPEFLTKNLTLMNYQKPTPIQKHSVAIAMAGHDLMCCAQTGSGKTAAFLIPVCAALDQEGSTVGVKGSAAPRCVTMAPTRELASQIELEAQKLTNRSPLRSVSVYGGADQRKQIKELSIGCDIIVATPGRLTDFVDRGIVTLRQCRFLILDEADRMLDMGFEPQIRRIVLQCDMPPKEQRQTLLFSATFPPEIQKLAQQFLRDYVWVAVGRVGSTTDSIKQQLVQSTNEKRHKLALVAAAIREGPEGRTLVFVQKKRTATWLKRMLAKGGVDGCAPHERFQPITSSDIHGDRSQAQRESALAAFRAGTCRVLVATDVAARGLDIADVVHVINMDLPVGPEDFDSYVHRIGRTGRAGHTGLATSLYVPGVEKAANGKVAPLLLKLFEESSQEIPQWFAQLPECTGRPKGGKSNNAPQRAFGFEGAAAEGATQQSKKRKDQKPVAQLPVPVAQPAGAAGEQSIKKKKKDKKDKNKVEPAAAEEPKEKKTEKKEKKEKKRAASAQPVESPAGAAGEQSSKKKKKDKKRPASTTSPEPAPSSKPKKEKKEKSKQPEASPLPLPKPR
eukprot:TRINITY_DN5758_c0_g1_i1.p1 TRINITY_DN5758_c0_g1~~TRINITY_DN5758_c0_g1_i1.p1  ORF type:complete len:591 (-),score=186.37 TRINITY_DN5758_c0_g1_i1:152-1924(-)